MIDKQLHLLQEAIHLENVMALLLPINMLDQLQIKLPLNKLAKVGSTLLGPVMELILLVAVFRVLGLLHQLNGEMISLIIFIISIGLSQKALEELINGHPQMKLMLKWYQTLTNQMCFISLSC